MQLKQDFPQRRKDAKKGKEHPEFIDSLCAFAPLREPILSNCTILYSAKPWLRNTDLG
jgi:hypothetical protein